MCERRVIRVAMLAAGLLWAGGWTVRGGQDEEYKVQAAFLYNFVKFVTWPETAFSASAPDLVIGILGTNPFGGALDAIQGSSFKGRTIRVRDVKDAGAAKGCHLLFIARSEQGKVGGILASLSGQPILTVSESAGFARAGGVIEFVIVNDTVRFKVNVDAARQRDLYLSSQLLGVAVEVIKN